VRTRPLRRYAVAALVVAGLVTATGCGPDVHPGRAAVVEGTDISLADADQFADDFCTLNVPALQQSDLRLSMSTVRAVALDLLVNDELLHQYAEENGLEESKQYKQTVAGLEAQAAQSKIPAESVDTYVKVLTARAYAEFVYGTAGQEKVQQWVDDADVTIDPRFGTLDKDGNVVAPDSGLSVPVSSLAKLGSALPPLTSSTGEKPDTTYADKLPASQRCG